MLLRNESEKGDLYGVGGSQENTHIIHMYIQHSFIIHGFYKKLKKTSKIIIYVLPGTFYVLRSTFYLKLNMLCVSVYFFLHMHLSHSSCLILLNTFKAAASPALSPLSPTN